MSDKSFTGEQLAILGEKGSSILVSAAAGSGKTTVLVERIIRRIIEENFSVDHLLIATFTRDAADNMKKKINESIRNRIKELASEDAVDNSETINCLKHQLDLLPNAYIQTLNSFCTRVIKEKGYLLEGDKHAIEPGIPVFDDNTKKILLNQSAIRVINENYEKLQHLTDEEAENSPFVKLTYSIGDGRTNKSLEASLVSVYNNLRSLPEYRKKLDNQIEKLKQEDGECVIRGLQDFLQDFMVLLKAIKKNRIALDNEINGCSFKNSSVFLSISDMWYTYASDVLNAVESGASSSEVYEVLSNISRLSTTYQSLPKNTDGDYDELYRLFAPIACCVVNLKLFAGTRAPNNYGKSGAEYKYLLSEECRVFFHKSLDEIISMQKERTECIEAFGKLLKELDDTYSSVKKSMHGMDFADQEHTAYRILTQYEEAQLYYREKFTEIYIDEYQDNSELQDAVIDSIAGDVVNVFRVGDVKQSIYKFRYAAPQLFMDKAENYSNGNGGRLMNMSYNFRSEPEILTFINNIFERLMTKEGAEIEYDDSQKLNASPYKKPSGKNPIVYFVDSGYEDENGKHKAMNKEARNQGVLKMVQKYLDKGYQPEDICILSKKNRTSSEIATYLCNEGIDAKYKDETKIFDDKDIHALCGLIIAISNQYRDEYLAGVLLADYSFSNFTLDELAEITIRTNSTGYKKIYLADKLRMYVHEMAGDKGSEELVSRVERFLNTFDDLRNSLILTDIGQLIEKIYEVSGIRSTLYEADGDEGLLKLSLFKDWLCDSYSQYGSDIAGIAGLIENMSIDLKSSAGITVNSTETGKVTCMTMHTSKGLEFPCVILAGLDEKGGSDKENIRFDSKLGFAIDDFDYENVRRTTSVTKAYFKIKNTLSGNAEMLRVLYVALTRAKEELSVVLEYDTHKKENVGFVNCILNYGNETFDSSYWRANGGKMGRAFLSAVLRTAEGKKILDLFDDIPNPVHKSDFDGFEVITDAVELPVNLFDFDSDDDNDDENYDDYDDNDESYSAPVEENAISVDLKKYPQEDFQAVSMTEEGMPVFKPYKYQTEAETSFKTSVSMLDNEITEKNGHINLYIDDFDSFLDDGSSVDSPAALGSYIHRLMRFFDFEKIRSSEDGYREEIQRLIDQGTIAESTRKKALYFEKNIREFAESDLGRRLTSADIEGKADYELPVLFASPVENDYTLVQGVIDCAFEEDDGEVIIDYKTDVMKRFPTDEAKVEETIRRHAKQLRFYGAALQASGHKVKEMYVWLIRENMAVKITF